VHLAVSPVLLGEGETYFPGSISPSLVSFRSKRSLEKMRPTFF
jgi:dihydrofolate reductase